MGKFIFVKAVVGSPEQIFPINMGYLTFLLPPIVRLLNKCMETVYGDFIV